MVQSHLSVPAEVDLRALYSHYGASKASSRLHFHEVDQFEVEENILTLHIVHFTPMQQCLM